MPDLFELMLIVGSKYNFHVLKIKKQGPKALVFKNKIDVMYNYPPDALKLPPNFGGFGLIQITGSFASLAIMYCSCAPST